MRKSDQASTRLLKAAKSGDQERHSGAMKSWLVAQQRRRDIWRAMATPVAINDEMDSRPARGSAEEN
jgi:hypothetical protein